MMTRSALSLTFSTLIIATIDCRAAAGIETVYAATSTGRIEKFDLSGTLLGGFSASASSIDVDKLGNAYVSFVGGGVASRFNPSGAGLNLFLPTHLTGDTGPYSIRAPTIGPDGNVYFAVRAGSEQNRIERFNPDGTSLGIFAPNASFGIFSFAFDGTGNIFAVTTDGVQKYGPNGVLLGKFVDGPPLIFDIALDSSNNVYVTSLWFQNRTTVEVYDSLGQLLRVINAGFDVNTVAIDANDVLFVGGSLGNSGVIRRFLPDGTLLGTFFQSNSPQRLEVIDLAIVNLIPEPGGFVIAAIAIGGVSLRFRRRQQGRLISPLG